LLHILPQAGDQYLALRCGIRTLQTLQQGIGVLARGGAFDWRSAPDLLDLRGASFPRISPDGDEVEVTSGYFDGGAVRPHNIRFSITTQRLEIDAATDPSLTSPVTSDLAIGSWDDTSHPTLDGKPLPLSMYERSRSLTIAPDKGSFVLGTEWNLRKFDRQGKQLWATSVSSLAWGVNASSDGRFVVATLGDGTIRWYTFEEGEEVLAVFIDRDLKRWVAWNPDGFFSFQGGGDSLIGYQVNRGPTHEGEFVRVDQLREVFYQPDLIAQILKPVGATSLAAARGRMGDVSKLLSGGLPPEIELISPEQATVTGDYLLQFRIKDMGGGRGRIVYRIDGAEIEGRAIDIRGTAADANNRYIPTANGAHTVTVAAYDAAGKIQGPPKTIRVTRSAPAPGSGSNLYVVAAGISHYSDNSLSQGVKFAAADADLIAARLKEQEGKGLYRRVNAVSLPDSKATIRNLQNEVAQAAKTVQPGDTFVLYLAGHGVAKDGEYYFIPYATISRRKGDSSVTERPNIENGAASRGERALPAFPRSSQQSTGCTPELSRYRPAAHTLSPSCDHRAIARLRALDGVFSEYWRVRSAPATTSPAELSPKPMAMALPSGEKRTEAGLFPPCGMTLRKRRKSEPYSRINPS
jgi:hypothetical protein